jgi:hypothetical protein
MAMWPIYLYGNNHLMFEWLYVYVYIFIYHKALQNNPEYTYLLSIGIPIFVCIYIHIFI